MTEDVFCAKTGRRIADDNVIQFLRRDDGPVPAATLREAEAQTIRGTSAGERIAIPRLAPEYDPIPVPFLAPEDDPI
jgi:hypothetical protein